MRNAMSLLSAIVLGLLFAMPVMAEEVDGTGGVEYTDGQYCESLGVLAERIVQARDQGVPINDVLNQLRQNQIPNLVEDSIHIAVAIYRDNNTTGQGAGWGREAQLYCLENIDPHR